MSKLKSVRLTHNALDIAREMSTLMTNSRNRLEAIKQSFQQLIDADREATNKQLRNLWLELHLAAGVPTTEMGDWDLDARYLEHGIAFLAKTTEAGGEDTPSVVDPTTNVVAEAADVTKH